MKNIKRGEIYYADLEPILGSEQGGIRPVLILQQYNSSSPTTIVVPITCQSKHGGHETHVPLNNPQLYPNSTALLEQVRAIDRQRLRGFVCVAGAHDMGEVDRAIHTSLGLKCHEGGWAV